MKINEVEQLVGISKKNIRFYEQEGLIAPSRNAENGYREYGQEDVAVLKEIKLLRKLSVPIEEIRKIQGGSYSLQDAMKKQMVLLKLQMDNLYQASLLCSKIDVSGKPLSQLDIDEYLSSMDEMESDGVSFANIKKKDTTNKYIAPIAVTIAIVALMMAFLYVLFWVFLDSRPHVVIMVVAFVLPVAVAAGVIGAMLQRIKEIKGGEEDAAGKY